MRNPIPPFPAVVSLLALALAGCALLSGSPKEPPSVVVLPSERLFLAAVSLDSAARDDLARGGMDPDQVEKDLDAELRYNLALRKQEEARDSAAAAVTAALTVRRLQPGRGNAGTFAAFAIAVRRGKAIETLEWDWQARALDNVPEEFAARHLTRAAASEVMARVRAVPPKSYEPPPPLHLMR